MSAELTAPRETEKNDLLEVLEDRCGNRATIMTSQVDPKHWHQLLGDPTVEPQDGVKETRKRGDHQP